VNRISVAAGGIPFTLTNRYLPGRSWFPAGRVSGGLGNGGVESTLSTGREGADSFGVAGFILAGRSDAGVSEGF
jgi:hypothetical protein